MAKTPSAKVSATSGQGVSRLSYQKTRALGGVPGAKAPTKESAQLPSRSALKTLKNSGMSINDYAKATPLDLGSAVSPVVQLLRLAKDG
jgi:hypothetical protein